MTKNAVIGSEVLIPEPTENDAWAFGDFNAVVIDILDNGNLIVEDCESSCWEIEPDRVDI